MGFVGPKMEMSEKEFEGIKSPALRAVLKKASYMVGPESIMGLGFMPMNIPTAMALPAPKGVPKLIVDTFTKKVAEAIEKNNWKTLVPFVETIRDSYGTKAAQDLANPAMALTRAYKSLGVDRGYQLLLKLHSPIYEKFISPLIY
jgi:hypothetical protein